jgi:peptidoglycan hydrolase CwlO-like protein
MSRGVSEQEEEIAMLEERIKSQKDVLERLRALGAGGERMVKVETRWEFDAN